MNRLAALAISGVLTACGLLPTPGPVTIPDPTIYLAQSRAPDGNAATPLTAGDPITYRRFDFGHSQAEDSFLTGPTSAITTWSYAPWGPFNASLGDGGENYELQGNAVRILSTQDGGAPGVRPLVPHWTVLTTDTIDCAQGWTTYSPMERGCRTMVNYPGIGPVDTVISEHLNVPEKFAERILLGKGWGRLAWQTFRASGLPAADRCPDFGQNVYRGWILTDCRYVVLIEPAGGTLTGAMLWHP